MRKAYLDANILLSISAGSKKEPDQYRLAVGVLEEIKNGEILGIISPLTLMEVIAVLRSHKGKEKDNLEKLSREKQLEFVLDESRTMYHKVIGELLRLPNLKFELGKRTDLNKLMDQALETLQEVRGKVRHHTRCSKCGSKNVDHSAFKGLGPDDMIHALLAKDSGCDILITFDRDFEDLKSLEKFEVIEFRVMRWQS